jgi:hypothetical protein
MSEDPVELVKYVIHNCNMWLDNAEKPTHYKGDGLMSIEEQRERNLYLLECFALKYLEEAIQKIKSDHINTITKSNTISN